MQQNVYEAAFAQIDITPDYPVMLIGRYRPEPSQGVLQRLFAQALLFRHGEEFFCLIAVDNLGLPRAQACEIRIRVAQLLGTDVAHVMLNFSHTHSAPDCSPHACNGERYFHFLSGQIAACVQAAKEKLQPCMVGWALTTAAIGENRREGGTALDDRLGGLLVTERGGETPIALAARIAVHPNILPAHIRAISSDFIGLAREELQACLGYPVMFLQGAAGNIKAAGTNGVGEGDDAVFREAADRLIEGVKRLQFLPQEITDLRMYVARTACTADIPAKEEAEAIAAQFPTPDAQGWLEACAALRSKGIMTQTFPVEVSYFHVNEGCLCGVADEIFCELALDVQARAGNPLVFFNGYTNGYMGYLPSRAEWYKGGYEVLYSYFSTHSFFGRVMPYRAETADQLVDFVCENLQARF